MTAPRTPEEVLAGHQLREAAEDLDGMITGRRRESAWGEDPRDADDAAWGCAFAILFGLIALGLVAAVLAVLL